MLIQCTKNEIVHHGNDLILGATVSNFLEDIQYSRTKITSIVT
jgi:hypothetical protein